MMHPCLDNFGAAPKCHATEDINSPKGFVRSLWAVLCLAQGGLLTAGVVCSSWTRINSDLSIHITCIHSYKIIVPDCSGNVWAHGRDAAGE